MKEKKKLAILKEKPKLENSDKLQKNEKMTTEKKIFLVRIIINIIFSLILITTFCLLWTSYSPVWKIFFLLRVWSFWSNTFYIITITIIDILLFKDCKKCENFNSFIRNDLIRIICPFSISTIVIYWELVLLGDRFQEIDNSLLDVCKSFFLQGLVLVFMCFDIFSAQHINKKNNCKNDLILISIIMAIHFAAAIFCKEVLNEYSYDYLSIADVRQIVASFIIIYILVLNGYIVFYLISDYFFLNEEIKVKSEYSDKNEDSGDKLKINEDKGSNIFSGLNKQTSREILNNNLYNKYSDSEQKNIKSIVENIQESIKEEKEESLSNIKNENKNSENDKYNISEKEENKNEIFEEKMEKYAAQFININTKEQMNKNKEDKKLLDLKKIKFGIKGIKIPVSNEEKNKE